MAILAIIYNSNISQLLVGVKFQSRRYIRSMVLIYYVITVITVIT